MGGGGGGRSSRSRHTNDIKVCGPGDRRNRRLNPSASESSTKSRFGFQKRNKSARGCFVLCLPSSWRGKTPFRTQLPCPPHPCPTANIRLPGVGGRWAVWHADERGGGTEAPIPSQLVRMDCGCARPLVPMGCRQSFVVTPRWGESPTMPSFWCADRPDSWGHVAYARGPLTRVGSLKRPPHVGTPLPPLSLPTYFTPSRATQRTTFSICELHPFERLCAVWCHGHPGCDCGSGHFPQGRSGSGETADPPLEGSLRCHMP